MKSFLKVFLVASLVGAILLLALVWALNFHPVSYLLDRPNYNNLTKLVRESPDGITYATCEDVELRVIDRDELIEGGIGALGNPYTDSQLIHKYFLEAYAGGEIKFSTLNGQSPSVRFTGLTDGGYGTYFVLDKVEFSLLNSSSANYKGAVLSFSPALSWGSLVEKWARCYKNNDEKLTTALHLNVPAFVIPDNTEKRYKEITFSCDKNNKLVFNEYSRYVRLNDVTEAIVGVVGKDGVFYAWDSSRESTVPVERRTLENWTTCQNDQGVLFSDYLETQKANLINIE